MIEIHTKEGRVIECSPGDIVPRRFGLNVKRRSILLEYEVPRHCILAHHPIEVDFGATGTSIGSRAPAGGYPSAAPPAADAPGDTALAESLRDTHSPWLDEVQVEQLAGLIGRLRALVRRDGGSRAGVGVKGAPAPSGKRPWCPRSEQLPEVAKASKRSKEPDIRKAFDLASGPDGGGFASPDALHSYVRGHLGFGKAEADALIEQGDAQKGLSFEEFSKCYWMLNPFLIGNRKGEVIIRKPGALGGLHPKFGVKDVGLDSLEDCEVYICTPTAQALIDCCKNCVILIGPCESSVFIRDCEDCDVWMAAQQLRTRDCKRCRFFLYCKTEPIIESSEDLSFAPWCAGYPGCSLQFEKLRFDPERNFWNALFDFTGKVGASNWRILPLDEVRELVVEYDDDPPGVATPNAPPDNPCPQVTYEMLCADPLQSEESTGQAVSSIPQTRPPPPPAPGGDKGALPVAVVVRDEEGRPAGRDPGARSLEKFPRRRE